MDKTAVSKNGSRSDSALTDRSAIAQSAKALHRRAGYLAILMQEEIKMFPSAARFKASRRSDARHDLMT